jgi:exopolysaccharide biosynthesis polyprenyl glycosylphosphotransferase
MRDRKLIGSHSVFVICDPKEQEEYANFINKENFYTIVGFDGYKALDRYHRQATLEHLHELGVSEIFISWNAIKNRMFLCWLFQAAGITIHILPLEIKQIYKDAELSNIGGMPCMTFKCPLITGKDFWIKRVFDFCFASLFVILTSPIYLAIALAIKLDSSGPVFYKQTRVGLHGQKFAVWKFRTMRPDADQMQKELEALNENKDGILFKMKDDPRVTRIGKFLRSYSLDELPQIFNVLRGEMSLIGPRPLATRDVAHFSERHFIRQEVLPGITGWWQVSGRSDILDFDQVMRLDLHYIENWSLLLDIKILFKTVAVVLRKQGAY